MDFIYSYIVVAGMRIVIRFAVWLIAAQVYASSVGAQAVADSQLVAASSKYKKPWAWRAIFGNNYRRDWSTPIRIPILHINTQDGGLTITKLKGGFETISLFMVTSDSTQYVLRTIDKDLKKLIPPAMKKTPLRAVVQDIVSNAEPYAPLTIAPMANALGFATSDPHLFYVDDTAFGQYHSLYDGKVCLLELRTPVKPGTRHEGMETPFKGVQADNHLVVLQKEFLKARLWDMILADWDRHPGQWYWGSYDSAGRKWLYPVPVDRDMVYFNSTGIFLKYTRIYAAHYLRGFTAKINRLYAFNNRARNMDRLLLNELGSDDWDSMIREVQSRLSDAVIEGAVNRLPAEILAMRGADIKRKLRSRRDGLYPAAMKYYYRLNKNVHIATNDKPDYYTISGNGRKVTIAVYNSGAKDESSLIYRRTFSKNETKRIYISGIGDEDNVQTTGSTAIKVKVFPKDHLPQHHDIRARINKLLYKSLNSLGQPGFKK